MPTCTLDVVSLLQVAHHEVAAVEEGANAIKVGYNNPLESTIASSYQTHVPTTLLGGAKTMVVGASMYPLPALKTYLTWDDSSTICL
jgi:hypothetical protein